MIMKKIISHKQPEVSSCHYAKKKYPQKWKVLGGWGGVGPVVCSAHTNVLTCVAEGHTVPTWSRIRCCAAVNDCC